MKENYRKAEIKCCMTCWYCYIDDYGDSREEEEYFCAFNDPMIGQSFIGNDYKAYKKYIEWKKGKEVSKYYICSCYKGDGET